MAGKANKSRSQLIQELAALRSRVADLETSAEQLRQSEEYYCSVVTAMAEGVVMQMRGGEITACNPAAEQILGLTCEQMMGRTSIDPRWRAIHEDESPFPGETHPAMVTLQTGQPQKNVIMGVHKPDGRLTWVSINAEPLFQPGDNEPYAVVTTFSDITALRQAEEQLRTSEEKYRVIFNNEIYAICIFDLETLQLLDVNEAYTRLYGYSREELLAGMTIHNITAEHEVSNAATQQAIREGTIFIPLRYHRKKDGTVFPIEIVGGPYQWQGRKVMFALAHDISDRQRIEDTLRESEARYHQVVDNLKEVVFKTDVQGLWLFLNPAWEEITGFSVADSLGQLFLNYVHPDDRQRNQELFASLIARQKDYYRHEIRYLTQSGGFRWIEVFARLDLNEADEMIGTYGTLTDITERKQAEQALQESEERLALTIKGADLGTWDWRVPSGEVVFNKRWAEMLGYSPVEIEPNIRSWEKLIHPDDLPATITTLNAHLERHSPIYKSEHRLRAKSGEWKWVLDIGRVIERDEHGYPLRAVGIHQDITEGKETEAALVRERALLRTIIDLLPDTIYVKDETGRKTVCNRAELLHLGAATEADVLGKTDADFYPSHMAAKFEADDRAVIQTGVSLINREEISPDPDGQPRWFLTSKIPVQDETGQVVGVVGVGRDITDRKQAEAEREKLIEELQTTLNQVKRLSGLLPICASCKKIRNDQGYWQQVEIYIHEHSEADFSHGICPDCMAKLYPKEKYPFLYPEK